MDTDQRHRLRSIVLRRLESLERAGLTHLPKPTHSPTTNFLIAPTAPAATHQPNAAALAPVAGAQPHFPATNRTDSPPRPTAPGKEAMQMARTKSSTLAVQCSQHGAEAASEQWADPRSAPTLEVLQRLVAACTRCDELARTRTQTVFGAGNPHAELCFMGEAPGADEDRTGMPFVGRAGQLLTDIIHACKLKREDVYILNTIKCRPPGNHNPMPHEAANCRGFLERQLELIRPQYICCLGAVAAHNLLQTQTTIGRLRGKFHTVNGIKVVCTYHPAYLLRNPSAKRCTWEDMKMLMRAMGVEL